MRNICVKNMRQIFRNFSEMCIGKFWNFHWHFSLHREYSESQQFQRKLRKIMLLEVTKVFDISSTK